MDKHSLRWTTVPLKKRVWSKAFLVLLLPALACLVYLQSGNLILSVVAVLFVVLTITPALLPTTYVLENEGLTVKHMGRTNRFRWETFRRLLVDKDVLLLSPFEKPCFLDTFRGQYLRFNPGEDSLREEAIQFVLPKIRGKGNGKEPQKENGS